MKLALNAINIIQMLANIRSLKLYIIFNKTHQPTHEVVKTLLLYMTSVTIGPSSIMRLIHECGVLLRGSMP